MSLDIHEAFPVSGINARAPEGSLQSFRNDSQLVGHNPKWARGFFL